MNSMVGAYHRSKSVESERRHKKKSKSVSDQSKPSSPREEKPVLEETSKVPEAVTDGIPLQGKKSVSYQSEPCNPVEEKAVFVEIKKPSIIEDGVNESTETEESADVEETEESAGVGGNDYPKESADENKVEIVIGNSEQVKHKGDQDDETILIENSEHHVVDDNGKDEEKILTEDSDHKAKDDADKDNEKFLVGNSNHQVEEDGDEDGEKIVVNDSNHQVEEAASKKNEKVISENSETVTENKHNTDHSARGFNQDAILKELIKSGNEQNAMPEPKQRKAKFFIAPPRTKSSHSDSDENSVLDPVIASSSKEQEPKLINSSRNAVQKEVNIPEPFSKFVDIEKLNEGLATEKVHLHSGHDDMTVEGLKHALKKKEDKSLKLMIRHNHWGADSEIRGLLWQLLCKHLHKAHNDDTYDEFAKDMFPPESPDDSTMDIPLPMFADYSHIEGYNLSIEGLNYAKKVTCVIEHTNPDITYCPLLLPIVSLFLHYMDPPTAYNCAYSLLREKEDTFIPQSNVLSEASKFVVRDLTKKYARHCFNHLSKVSGCIDTFFCDWIWWIFSDLPFPYLVRVIDCFISEGFKVLYRVVLALLITYAKYHAKKSSSTVPNVLTHLRNFCQEPPITVDKLLKVAFSIKGLSRKEVKKLLIKHTMYINSVRMVAAQNEQNASQAFTSRSFSAVKAGGLQIPMSRSFSGPILLQQLNSSILGIDMLYAIWTWLPTRYAVCQPLLLYTSEEHGTSLVTLYGRVENYQPTVIVIKNTHDEIFGAFCSTNWRERRQSTKNLSYFGTGETFLFTLSPEKKKYDWVGLKEENIPNTANMFQAGDRHVLTVGGGSGEAILLDENLLHCRTEHCDTFDNDPLCDSGDFTCKVVEVYGFQ